MSPSIHQTDFLQAQNCVNQGKFSEAEQILTRLVDVNPSARLFYQLGVAKALAGKQHRAINDFNQAIQLDPKMSEGYNGLALALYELGELRAADNICQEAFQQTKPCSKLYSTWASILRALSKLPEAKALLEKALKHMPNNATLWCNLAAVLGELNDGQGAVDCFEKAIELNPALIDVHERIADHRVYHDVSDSHIKTMHACLDKAKTPSALAGVCFGLAKAYEKLKDYQQAAEFYRRANDSLYAQKPYQHDLTKAQFQTIKTVFTESYISKLSQCTNLDATPIFIIGMPRSGTSLVEQILASHSSVFGAGELNHLKNLLLRSSDIVNDDFVRALSELTPERGAQISKNYLRLIREFSRDAKYITDKMPHNFRFVGLIACLFPNAKIIHCMRGKQDVVLSNYKAHFATNLRYSTNLKAINQFYELYEDLMAFWYQKFGERILPVEYEQLVNQQQAITQDLLDYCELPWQEGCLSFHQTQRTVATASASQVKQPLFRHSINSWKNYEAYFPELNTTTDAPH